MNALPRQQVVGGVTVGFGLVLAIVAVVLFVLGAFTDVWTRTQMIALGLGFFAASTRVP